MDEKFKKLLLIIVICTLIVGVGIVFKLFHLPFANLIFSIGIALEVMCGGAILIYLLKNKNL